MWLLLAKIPLWLKVGAGMGLLLGVMQTVNWWNNRDLKRDLAKQEQLLKETQESAAKAAALSAQQLEREAANREMQQAAIDRQNQRINSLAARAREVEATAAMAAFRVTEEGRLIAEALRDKSSPVPAGYDGLNQYLQQRFQQVRK